MIRDQWVPCDSQWQEKFPGACAEAPSRPKREGDDFDHYHLETNPSVGELAESMKSIPLPSYKPRKY